MSIRPNLTAPGPSTAFISSPGGGIKLFEPERYRVALEGFGGKVMSVALYDPVADAKERVDVKTDGADGVTVEFEATDMPRLLTIVTR